MSLRTISRPVLERVAPFAANVTLTKAFTSVKSLSKRSARKLSRADITPALTLSHSLKSAFNDDIALAPTVLPAASFRRPPCNASRYDSDSPTS